MSNRAWVTLATNDSYGLGALVLAHSLRRAGSVYPAVVLITPSVTDAMRERLGAVFGEVVLVDVLDSRDAAHLAMLQRPELGITFTKIHCWNLTQYEKCVFLDADTLVLQNCDELFDREELSAAPDVGWPDCFNSGLFVFKPSADTYSQLITFAKERGSFDGGDQGLLNSFFSDWARGDINKHLPFVYNVTSAAFYSYIPALKHYGQGIKIIHFIGATKPWLQQYNWENNSVDAPEHLKEFLQFWWDIFVRQVHTQLDQSMVEELIPEEEVSQESPPELPPPDISHYYEPTVNPESEFHWHHPVTNLPENEPENQKLDLSQFYDPWQNYRGNTPHYEQSTEQNSISNKIYNETQISQIWDDQQNVNFHESYQAHSDLNKEQWHSETLSNNYRFEHFDQEKSGHSYETPHLEYHHHSHSDHHQLHQSSSQNNEVTENFQILHEQNNNSSHYSHISQSFIATENKNEFSSQNKHDQPPNFYNHHQESQIDIPEKQNWQYEHQIVTKFIDSYQAPPFIQPKPKSEHIYCVYLDHKKITKPSLAKTSVINTNSETSNFLNGHTSNENDEYCDDIIPRHPYDGFYLRHTATIDSRGRKICSHEIPPTPILSPEPETDFPFEWEEYKHESVQYNDEDHVSQTREITNETGVAGNLAKVVPGAIATQRQAIDELTRRQGWESGNIDYMGADSFDNIWAKISQTLNQPRSSPPRQSPPKQSTPRQSPPKQSPPKQSPPRQSPPRQSPPKQSEPTPEETPISASTAESSPVLSDKQTTALETATVESVEESVEKKTESDLSSSKDIVSELVPPVAVKASEIKEEQLPSKQPVPEEQQLLTDSVPVPQAKTEVQQPVPEEQQLLTDSVTVPQAKTEVQQPVPKEQQLLTDSVPVPQAKAEFQPEIEKPSTPQSESLAKEPSVDVNKLTSVIKSTAPIEVLKESEVPVNVQEKIAESQVPVAAEPIAVESKQTEGVLPATPPVTPQPVTTPVTQSIPAELKVEETAKPDSPIAKPDTIEKKVTPQATESVSPTKSEALDSSATDSPPLANTPSKEEAPTVPAAKSEERRRPAGRLLLKAPAAADPLPTPDSEAEDASALAQSIISSELQTPTVTSPSPSAEQPSPALPLQPGLAVQEPEVPSPPIEAVSLAQIGVKPTKTKPTTAAQIASSVSDAPTSPTEVPKKKLVKKVVKKEATGGEAPVPPPRKKEKKPKEK